MPTKILIGLALTLVIAIFIPLYWATEPGRQESARERQVEEAVGRGAELYTLQCAACHGPAGEGNIGPALKGITQEAVELEKTIARGIAGTAMPAMGDEDGGPLKRHQINDLVTFMLNWDQSRIDSSPIPAAAPPATPEPAPLPIPAPTPSPSPPPTASPVNVDEIYTAKCAMCHGDKRQGVSGLGPELTPESLTPLDYTEIRDAILNGRSGTAMPPFKGTLTREEVDALVQYIKDTSP